MAGLEPRLLAAKRLREVLLGAAFSPFGAGEIADSRDRALANKLVTTALRRHGHINIVITDLLEKGMPAKAGTFEAVLRLSLAHLLYLPELGAHSAVFLGVEALKRDAKARHLSGLLNAVLRRAQGSAARYWDLPPGLLFPEPLRSKWQDQYGADAVTAFGEALLEGAPLDLTLKANDAELIEALRAQSLVFDSVRVLERDRPVEALPGYADGQWWVQDVAASLPARLLGLAEGARVLDLCAAPGGKTAQLVKAGYAVTALDSDGNRLVRLNENMGRLGYSAEVVEADAGDYAPAEPFDGILLDAPCSATGTFRRHPEVVWHRDAADIAGRAALQRTLLTHAAHNLKPNGSIIYCVCSLEEEEGEAQAQWVAEHLPALEPWPIMPAELAGLGFAVTAEGFVRTHPAQALPGEGMGTQDGFFIARFRKR